MSTTTAPNGVLVKTFAEAVTHFAKENPDQSAYIAAARIQYQEEGRIEIDDNAVISESEEGAYVMAWVWVDKLP